MPIITVKTTITSTYDVPDVVPLERIQNLALCELSESDEAVFDLQILHGRSISTIFLGDEQFDSQSVEHSVTEA